MPNEGVKVMFELQTLSKFFFLKKKFKLNFNISNQFVRLTKYISAAEINFALLLTVYQPVGIGN